jgi:hypothetical protein
MYFTKASKTLPFLNRIDDNIGKGTYVLYRLFNKESKEHNKGDIHYVQAIFWFFRHNR